MNWGNLLTKQDGKILRNLNLIAENLAEYFKKNRKVVFELHGHFCVANFDEWKFPEPSDYKIASKRNFFTDKLMALGNDPHDLPDDFSIKNLSLWIKERKAAPLNPKPSVFDNDIAASHLKNDALIADFIREFSNNGKVHPRRRSLIARSFNPMLEVDPFELSFTYLMNFIDSQTLSQSREFQTYKSNFYDKETDDDNVIEEAKSFLAGHDFYDFFDLFIDKDNSIELIANKLAMHELYQEETSAAKLPSYAEALELFMSDFLSIPLDYWKGPNTKSASLLVGSATKIKGLEILKAYENSEEQLIIHFPAYLSYKSAISFLYLEESNKFWKSKFIYTPVYGKGFSFDEILLAELMTIITVRLELIDQYFEEVINKLRSKIGNEAYFKSNEQSVEFFIKYLQNLIDHTDEYSYSILQRIKLPKPVSILLTKSVIEILEGKLAIIQGRAYNDLLMPVEHDALQITSELDKRLLAFQKNMQMDSKLPHFENKKMYWPDNKRMRLEKMFSALHHQKNSKGLPFMTEIDVKYMLNVNFSCYQGPFNPMPLKFNGHSSTLKNIGYQLFFSDKERWNKKSRYAQFLIQNFEMFCNEGQTQKQFKTFETNIKGKTPKQYDFVDILNDLK